MSKIQSDILANAPGARGLKLVAAAVLNPSARAVVLIRLATGKGKLRYWIARNLLITLHSIDIGRGARIGPRLKLPHPFGIVIGRGACLGSDVTVYHSVTLGHKKGGYPTVADLCILYPGAVIVGACTIGHNCTVGANAFIDRDVAPHSTAISSS